MRTSALSTLLSRHALINILTSSSTSSALRYVPFSRKFFSYFRQGIERCPYFSYFRLCLKLRHIWILSSSLAGLLTDGLQILVVGTPLHNRMCGIFLNCLMSMSILCI
uniref:Glutathione S-transferase 2 n=1 Tax=Schistocephalus solidus TaxID=70667 RepID=A0A0X3PAE0_SCHSO